MPQYTEAKKNNNRKWDANNLDRISVALPKGYKARLQDLATNHGQSVNGFLKTLIDEAMERDAAGGGSGFSAPVDDRTLM